MEKNGNKGERNQQVQAYTYILQFSINMIVPIFSFTFLGYWLDTKLGTSFLVILGIFCGALVGGTSIFKISKRMLKKDETSYTYPVVDVRKEDKKQDD